MTVGDLIEALQKFPLTATVYRVHENVDAESDYDDPRPRFDDSTSEVLL